MANRVDHSGGASKAQHEEWGLHNMGPGGKASVSKSSIELFEKLVQAGVDKEKLKDRLTSMEDTAIKKELGEGDNHVVVDAVEAAGSYLLGGTGDDAQSTSVTIDGVTAEVSHGDKRAANGQEISISQAQGSDIEDPHGSEVNGAGSNEGSGDAPVEHGGAAGGSSGAVASGTPPSEESETSEDSAVGGGDDTGSGTSGTTATGGEAGGQASLEPGSAPPVSGQDLYIMGHDFKPDPDDLQAAIAGKMVTDKLGLNTLAVGSTVGTQDGESLEDEGASLLQKLHGDNFVDARTDQAIAQVADRVEETINNGGQVKWAEGGQTQFAESVMDELANRGINTQEHVTLYQHSKVNEEWSGDLSGIQEKTQYQKIDDGNDGGNGTADFAANSEAAREAALNSEYGEHWQHVFDNYEMHGNNQFDFSDTVELVNGALGMDDIKTVDDFFNTFGDADPSAPGTTESSMGSGALVQSGSESESAAGAGSTEGGDAFGFNDQGELTVGDEWGGWDAVTNPTPTGPDDHEWQSTQNMLGVLQSEWGMTSAEAGRVVAGFREAAKAAGYDPETPSGPDDPAGDNARQVNVPVLQQVFESFYGKPATADEFIAAFKAAFAEFA